jgi:hypothetical protein
MPKSKKPRVPPAVKNAVQATVVRAQALDRRRQAQIANQIGTINRLLGEDHGYTEEMAILHQGAAALAAENEELRARVAELEQAVSVAVTPSEASAG